MEKTRFAVVGTAGSWVKTPWDDPGLVIASLNDAYMSRDPRGGGFPRADMWFELHPFEKMWFRKKSQRVVSIHDIPDGAYVRPEGHLEWLREQATRIPVFLQAEPPAGWPPNAKRFPLEEVEAVFREAWNTGPGYQGPYWSSGPSYMIAWAIWKGFKEIQVYGIHLATEDEYIQQMPLFSHLLGYAQGLGIKVVMAEESPVLKHPWKYGYDRKPTKTADPRAQQAADIHSQRAALLKSLAAVPRWRSKAAALDRLRRLTAQELDMQMQMARSRPTAAVQLGA